MIRSSVACVDGFRSNNAAGIPLCKTPYVVRFAENVGSFAMSSCGRSTSERLADIFHVEGDGKRQVVGCIVSLQGNVLSVEEPHLAVIENRRMSFRLIGTNRKHPLVVVLVSWQRPPWLC